MSGSADLIGYSEDGNIQLLVEIKKAKNVSPEWVEQFRRNLLTHAIIPASNFFPASLTSKHLFMEKFSCNRY